MKTLDAIGERALIERIRERVDAAPSWVALGIGDDAAAIEIDAPRGAYEILTTDSLIEGVHFRREWSSCRDIGHKALAVNLSDLAAMGAVPRALLLSLALPASLTVADFDELIEGFMELAKTSRSPLVGGNLTRSPGPIMISVTAMGITRRRRLLTRGGGKPGDLLFLTGSVGAAAAGLAMLEAATPRESVGVDAAECVARYARPEARLRCGIIVARSRAASACIDLSDGLAAAARQLAEASGTGVELRGDAIPLHPGARRWFESAGGNAVSLALAGGEDYELLFAVPARRQRSFQAAVRRGGALPVTAVGQLTREPGARLLRGNQRENLSEGFSHFTDR